jgi:hypothetical protein
MLQKVNVTDEVMYIIDDNDVMLDAFIGATVEKVINVAQGVLVDITNSNGVPYYLVCLYVDMEREECTNILFHSRKQIFRDVTITTRSNNDNDTLTLSIIGIALIEKAIELFVTDEENPCRNKENT